MGEAAPSPLPQPQLKQIGTGLSLLPPLSRKGKGPGIIVLVPEIDNSSTATNLSIVDGVPSSLIKWAEEGYTVVEIRKQAWSNGKTPLLEAVSQLAQCDACQPKDVVGIVCESLIPLITSR